VIRITLVFILALFPSLVSLWLINRSQQRFSNRLRRIRIRHEYNSARVSDFLSIPLEIENKPAFIGDLSCRFNAYSPHLRCAVNPAGPCEGCRQYEAKTGTVRTV
jgi:hypothetical protein